MNYVASILYTVMFECMISNCSAQFTQSRGCVAHSQDPEVAFQSQDYATIVCNLKIVQVTHANYRIKDSKKTATGDDLRFST